jgi:hypothetical protein
MAWNHLTFANHFHQTGDKVSAVRAAGSKSKNPLITAGNWLARDDVKRYLLSLREESKAFVVRSNAELVEEAHRLIDEGVEIARRGKPVIGKNGSAIIDPRTGEPLFTPDAMGLFKGGELKGRAAAMFTDVQRQEGEMASMKDEELTGFLVGAITSNPTLCKAVAEIPGVVREVYAADERARRSEGGEGASESEAQSLPSASEASRTPEGWRH